MRSGVVMQDCVKLTRVLSTVVGWCRIRIAVSLCKRVCKAYPCAFDGGWVVQEMRSGVVTHESVQSLPVCFRRWLGGAGYA